MCWYFSRFVEVLASNATKVPQIFSLIFLNCRILSKSMKIPYSAASFGLWINYKTALYGSVPLPCSIKRGPLKICIVYAIYSQMNLQRGYNVVDIIPALTFFFLSRGIANASSLAQLHSEYTDIKSLGRTYLFSYASEIINRFLSVD